MWLVDTSTSRERNFGIRAPFRVLDNLLERFIREEQLLIGLKQSCWKIFGSLISKKIHLGSQNGSECLGPKKMPKIVNCATIKETEKLKETMVRVQVK